jgi:type II secretory pathway pseudopilin PulG
LKLNPYLRRKRACSREQGYVLIVMLLFLALMAVGLTAVAPSMAQRIRREREIELIHRGRQYVRGIRLFYRKFGRYPLRLEELENTNRIRFIRKRYKDPMTSGGEWRLIHYGEAQLTPLTSAPLLPGATTPGASAAPGVASSAASSSFASTFSLGSGQTSTTPSQTGTTSAQTGTTQGQAGGTQGASADSSQSGQSGAQPGQPGTPAGQVGSLLGGPTFGGGPVVGVASTSKKQSIKELNKKDHYNDWEFVYDPRLDVTIAQPQAGIIPGQQNPLAPGVQAPGALPPGAQPAPGSPGMPGMQPTTR